MNHFRSLSSLGTITQSNKFKDLHVLFPPNECSRGLILNFTHLEDINAACADNGPITLQPTREASIQAQVPRRRQTAGP